MKTLSLATVLMILAVEASCALGQATAWRTSANSTQETGGNASPALATIQRAAAGNEFVFLFFWKEKSPQTDKAWSTLEAAVSRMAGRAEVASIRATDPAERQLVERFGVSRSPMPLVLAVAPCGVVTRGFTGAFDENQLRTALVSPCTQLCMKGLRNNKMVFVCVVDQTAQQAPASVPQVVRDFKADERYGKATEVVMLDARDQAEATFLRALQVDAQTPLPVAVLMAPPGSMIGKFDGTATKQDIVAKLASAQSGCCPGGKCGPGGCGPRKQ